MNCDEERFINALAPLLKEEGYPAHFIVDTGRSGKQPTQQQAWGDWCNVQGAGFGTRPTIKTDNALVDAFVWVKPGGEVSVPVQIVIDSLFPSVYMSIFARNRLLIPGLVRRHV